MRSIREVLDLAIPYLKDKGVSEPRRIMEEVIAHLLKVERLSLYMDLDRPLQDFEVKQLSKSLARLGKREPWQYVCGSVEFYGCDLVVTPDVLIPRQETELLVDKIVKEIPKESSLTLWDVCCGSGCIGIALKKARPRLKVVLSDFSEKALLVAIENSKRNNVDVDLRQGDLFAPFSGEKADIIVSNPPYVKTSEMEALEPEVRDYEPHEALVAEEDGLAFYRRIKLEGLDFLKSGGKLWLEHGTGQGVTLQDLFDGRGKSESDWAGHDRFFLLENQ